MVQPYKAKETNYLNSSTAKRNATFTMHTYIHMYATLLNDELMNKT